MSKINYAAEMRGGSPAYQIKKFQTQQLEMCWTVIGPRSHRWNKQTLLQTMDWMDISQTLSFVSNKLTYKILHHGTT